MTEAWLVVALVLTASGVVAFLTGTPEQEIDPSSVGPFLWLYLALFTTRVVGQVFVRFRAPHWLPPMHQWNLVPYPILLPIQLGMLVFMGWMATDLTRAGGFFSRPNPDTGHALVWFGFVYASVMLVRYVVRMGRMSEQRWSGGAVPIVFHFVLAAFVWTLGIYHASY